MLAGALLNRGRIHEAREQAEAALTRVGQIRTRYLHDDRQIQALESDLVEQLGDIHRAGGDLEAAAQRYREALELKRQGLKAQRDPAHFMFTSFFLNEVNEDGNFEHGRFCDYFETQLRLANVLRRTGRRYEAEEVLGECMLAAGIIAAERPGVPRYQIAHINSWALASLLLSDRRPSDADACAQHAVMLWYDVRDAVPASVLVRSGVYGPQGDWSWFRSSWPARASRIPADSRPDAQAVAAGISTTIFKQRAQGRSFFRARLWQAAIDAYTKAAQADPASKPYDGLYVSMAHSQLGQHDEAEAWYKKSLESMKEGAIPVDYIGLRNRAKTLLDEPAAFGTETKVESATQRQVRPEE